MRPMNDFLHRKFCLEIPPQESLSAFALHKRKFPVSFCLMSRCPCIRNQSLFTFHFVPTFFFFFFFFFKKKRIDEVGIYRVRVSNYWVFLPKSALVTCIERERERYIICTNPYQVEYIPRVEYFSLAPICRHMRIARRIKSGLCATFFFLALLQVSR